MSARDELAKLLFRHSVSDGCGDTVGEIADLCDKAADAILAAGYRKPRTVTTVEELDALPQGTKLYSPATTHSWVLNDLSQHGGVKVHGTGGGYTYLEDFIKHEAPLVILHEP